MGGDAELGGPKARGSWVSFRGASLQPCDPWSICLCAKGRGVGLGFFHCARTQTLAARGRGAGGCLSSTPHQPCLPDRIQGEDTTSFSGALPHCLGTATPGVCPGGRSSQPEPGWDSAPLWLAGVAYSSAPKAPEKRLDDPDLVCTGDGGCVCGAGGDQKLVKSNVL